LQAITKKNGKVTIHIPSDGIILSRQSRDFGARNEFKGIIALITKEANFTGLKIDIGQKLDVLISPKSHFDLNPQIGEEIYVTLKATSIKVN